MYNRKIQLTNLNTRISLLKDQYKLLKTLSDNKLKINTTDIKDFKQSLEYCKELKRTIKVNTNLTTLVGQVPVY